MRALRELVRIIVGLILGAALYESLFVQTGWDRLWVLLVAGGLIILALRALRKLRE